MKGMFVKDMEIMRGNMKTFIGVYIIAIFCFLSTSAGPSFLISYVSVLAAVMALNTIASDDMDNGMPYIFTFPISRKEYVKEKYLLGAGMVTVLWAVAVAIAIGVNASGYRMVSWEELIRDIQGALFFSSMDNVFTPFLHGLIIFFQYQSVSCDLIHFIGDPDNGIAPVCRMSKYTEP